MKREQGRVKAVMENRVPYQKVLGISSLSKIKRWAVYKKRQRRFFLELVVNLVVLGKMQGDDWTSQFGKAR